VLFLGLLIDGVVARWEAVGLLLMAGLYTTGTLRSARQTTAPLAGQVQVPPAGERPGGESTRQGMVWSTTKAVIGLLLLLLGGHWLVGGAVGVARSLGMSERIVGLTIVAVGTSLPELVTGLVAAFRGHSDLAVGNVIGSNIFNILFCLGSAALVGRVGASLSSLTMELVALVLMTALLLWVTRRARRISRPEGALALLCYLVLMAITLVRG
jgi:cation:H+ antiporter